MAEREILVAVKCNDGLVYLSLKVDLRPNYQFLVSVLRSGVFIVVSCSQLQMLIVKVVPICEIIRPDGVWMNSDFHRPWALFLFNFPKSLSYHFAGFNFHVLRLMENIPKEEFSYSTLFPENIGYSVATNRLMKKAYRENAVISY